MIDRRAHQTDGVGSSRLHDQDSSRPDWVASFDEFDLRPGERLLRKKGEPISLGARALDLLITLVERAGEVVSQRELMDYVWPNVTVEEANLRVHMAFVRRALQDRQAGARYIVNVPGRGYSFIAPVKKAPANKSARRTEVAASSHGLPARLTRMVGRDDTVRVLSAQLMMCRFVSIVGPGGMGKTTVAISVARALLDGFGGAVFFVDLAALADPRLVPTAVATALGFIAQSNEPLLSLLANIGNKKILLVLDNCEHVVDAAASLAEYVITKAPQTHVLTTSREPLRADGEHVHLLHALECPPDSVTAQEAVRYAAVQLFMERAAASGYDAELSDDDAPIVAGICRKIDGIALAIELAASCVGLHGIRGTAELLENRFRLIWQGRRTALPRHQTLNALLDWSYNLLSEQDRLVLCALSAFVGDFTLAAACSALSDAPELEVTAALTRLVTKSLVSTKPINGSTYYRLLDTTRAYAAAKLTDRGEARRVASRHASTYSEFLQSEPTIQTPFAQFDPAGYAHHLGNVRAALEWSLSEDGDAAMGVRLAAGAVPLLISLSLLDECAHWCERAIDRLDQVDHDARQEMTLKGALALSSMFTRGNGDKVRGGIERALSLAVELQDRSRQIRLLAGLNIFLTRVGDFSGALSVAERALEVAQTTESPVALVLAEWMIGVSLHLAGNQRAAQHHCELAAILAAPLGDFNANFFGYDHRIRAMVALGRAMWLRGFSQQAVKIAQNAIDVATNLDHPVSVCISLIYGATVFLWIGDLDKTEGIVDQLLVFAERHLLAPYRAVGIGLKGQLAVARNEVELGLGLLRDALKALGSEQHNVLLTSFVSSIAEGLRKIGQFEEAFLNITGAIAKATSSGATYDLADMLRIKAQIVADISPQDRALAADCLTDAISIARDQSALAFELRCATILVQWLSESGKRDDARRLLTPIYERLTEGFETADLRSARRLIESLE